jgi:hypothetical protein
LSCRRTAHPEYRVAGSWGQKQACAILPLLPQRKDARPGGARCAIDYGPMEVMSRGAGPVLTPDIDDAELARGGRSVRS